jgi:tetratricopeptide (TPR) repeat protein
MNDVKQNFCASLRSFKVTVLNEAKARLDRQAVVKVHDQKRNGDLFQTTTGESETTFCAVDFGDYDIEVSALGYLTAHKEAHIAGAILSINLEVVLEKDPTAVDLNAADDAIPTNARKDVKRAVYYLKSRKLKEAQKQLEKVHKFTASSAQVNFLFGYLFLQMNDLETAEGYLIRAAALDPKKVQTLTLLGRVQLVRQHLDDAKKILEGAVLADPEDWMAHNLLADVYLRQKEYEKALEQGQRAIEKGKGAASAAQLVIGQALANLGRDREGVQALKNFLQSDPKNPAAPQVQGLITQIEKRDSGVAGTGETQTDLALAASPLSLPESAWGPPGVDDVKPSVATGVSCPYQQVVDGSGERAKQLVDNITRFAAIEDLVHEQLDQTGNPITKETRKFDYVASISETRPGFLSTDEYRNVRYGIADLPDRIVTMGFMTLALIFHPDMRDNFQMSCEGLGDWHGQATWIMHFQQREDKPSRFADYTVGAETYPMKLKGRAWITANNFQIVRIESDLAAPLPLLSVQHQIAEYGPVHFEQKKVELWLPQNVDIFFELNRHRYHRRHSFDHYMLFSVNAEDKTPLSKNMPESKPGQNP